MPEKKNTLADLAKRLDIIVFGLVTDGHPCDETIDIRKAQLIVAELAKVMPRYMAGKPGHSFIETEAYKAYRNCSVIAGSGNPTHDKVR